MSTVKIVLRKRLKADGTMPLILRVTKDRKHSYINLEYSVKESEWDDKNQRVRKSHPNAVRVNNYLVKKLAEASNTALQEETEKADVTARAIKHKIKPNAATGKTFFSQADAFLDSLRIAGKYNQFKPDRTRINNFRRFIQNSGVNDIALTDVTPALLERFRGYLRGIMQLGERSAVNHLVVIRSVFSFAIKENAVDPKHYPFGKGKVKIKYPDSKKIGLTMEEVQRLEELELTIPAHDHARNLWLISFYFAGMRVSDVLRLKWSDIQDNRLHYSMGKNNKGGSLKIPEKAARILETYHHMERNRNDLIFHDLAKTDIENKYMTQRQIAFRVSAIDKLLRLHVAPAAGIDKKLSMHIARHTFGNISGDKIPIQMLQRLYRHSSITTTIGYQQNFIYKEIDNALSLILEG